MGRVYDPVSSNAHMASAFGAVRSPRPIRTELPSILMDPSPKRRILLAATRGDMRDCFTARLAVVVVLTLSGAFQSTTAAREISSEDRIRAQAAIERVYYQYQVGATRSFEQAVPRAILEAKVRTYLEQSVALGARWGTPVTSEMLHAEMRRIARNTRLPDRLEEIYAALGHDDALVEECFARPLLVQRMLRSFENGAVPEFDRPLADGWPKSEANGSREGALVGVNCPAADGWTNGVLGKVPHHGEAPGVWTGSLVIVWGGTLSGASPGLRYDPLIDDWSPMSTVGAPSKRSDHTIVWTGSQAIVWGGTQPGGPMNDGARYDPATDAWQPMSVSGAPTARNAHTAVWTGLTMIVWGGANGNSYPTSGGRYDPVANTWKAIATVGSPSPRGYHSAVWTGSKMVVWGGSITAPFLAYFNTGGRYDPSTDTWQATSLVDAPTARSHHRSVWTGQRMIVWGGYWVNGVLGAGKLYDPSNDVWTSMTTTDEPTGRQGNSMVWTGSKLIVWGGRTLTGPTNSGGLYDPQQNAWSQTSQQNAPVARGGHVAVWTGSKMVVYGGTDGLVSPYPANTGGRYDPVFDSWTPTTTYGTPLARSEAAGVWTGTHLIVWSGGSAATRTSGGRYDPLADAWLTMSGGGISNSGRSVVWCGGRMIVWGEGTGSRYDPISDLWAPVSSAGAPAARTSASAVCAQGQMIVWGGTQSGGSAYLGDGGRYDVGTDSWQPIATTGAPTPRTDASIVWTGRQVIVWGGYDGSPVTVTGALYDPVADQWQPMSTVDAPIGRTKQATVWTGTEMIVWGGFAGGNLNTGGRFNPSSDTWTATSTGTNVPTARYGHTLVWTGNRMILYGGGTPVRSDHMLYDPVADHWTPLGTLHKPQDRRNHVAVWTGSEMLVWGGYNETASHLESGGGYTPDTDGDGRGDSCDCAPLDAGSWAIPGEVAPLEWANPTLLRWTMPSPAGGPGTVSDVMRGRLGEWPVGSGAAETCLESGGHDAESTETEVPAPEAGFYYLVRGRNACGAGGYGMTSSGAPRATATCP